MPVPGDLAGGIQRQRLPETLDYLNTVAVHVRRFAGMAPGAVTAEMMVDAGVCLVMEPSTCFGAHRLLLHTDDCIMIQTTFLPPEIHTLLGGDAVLRGCSCSHTVGTGHKGSPALFLQVSRCTVTLLVVTATCIGQAGWTHP